MNSKRCPRCGTNDYYVSSDYDVSCGYCGFVVANIKESFLAARKVVRDENKSGDPTGLVSLARKA